MELVDHPGKIGPGDDEVDSGDTVVDGLLQLMQQARQEVLIVSPYFVPGAEMMREFAQLRAKGIRIRVLTNSLASTDAPAAHAGYARYRKQLLAQGVELHEMRTDQEGTAAGFGSTAGLGSDRRRLEERVFTRKPSHQGGDHRPALVRDRFHEP